MGRRLDDIPHRMRRTIGQSALRPSRSVRPTMKVLGSGLLAAEAPSARIGGQRQFAEIAGLHNSLLRQPRLAQRVERRLLGELALHQPFDAELGIEAALLQRSLGNWPVR